MTIPEIRDRLEELSSELGCEELRQLAEELKRRRNGSGRKIESAAITEEMRQNILFLANSGMTQQQVAKKLNINQGRVSEVLFGKRQ